MTGWQLVVCNTAGMVLVFHTFDDIVDYDYDIFDGKLRWMGLNLTNSYFSGGLKPPIR